MNQEWHIVTCEYPPQSGGVSDYTRLVAEGLAAEGDTVHVWCPAGAGSKDSLPGITVHRTLGNFTGADLKQTGSLLDEFPSPRRLLVQWVPHGYLRRSMNMAFCLWLWKRARRCGDSIQLMVHEPFLAFREGSWKQDMAAVVHRVMTVILLGATERVWVSIPAWKDRLRPYFLGRRVPIEWLPVPSSVAVFPGSRASQRSSHIVLGHFGTHGTAITGILTPLIPRLLADSTRSLHLIGMGSREYRETVVRKWPDLDEQIFATGEVSEEQVSHSIGTCDIMIQPYPDGVSSRRTSAMAALCHAKALVTTEGRLTEDIWRDKGAVALVPCGQDKQLSECVEHLLAHEDERNQLGLRGKKFYMEHFHKSRTISALRAVQEDRLALCES